MKNILLAVCILFVWYTSFCQLSSGTRGEKIESILKIQDTRSIHDGILIGLLSDTDTVVRERAVRAYGSIQDTTVISLLVEALTDHDEDVRNSAAFAIGQTAQLLSEDAVRSLQHDLLWSRIDKMTIAQGADSKTVARLIEELGRFATVDGLKDLLLRFGTSGQFVDAVTMSIARFAIRNVVIDDAVQYLLRLVHPMESTTWHTVYAFQRIGNHRLIRTALGRLIPLDKHSDPLVRLNLATLLGKVKLDGASVESLVKLAEYDADWRVRVNALKALSNFRLRGRNDVADVFRRSFFDANPYIAVTALAGFGSMPVRANEGQTTIKTLELIARNEGGGYIWWMQGEAAIALAKLWGKDAASWIHPNDDMVPQLQAYLLRALGESGAEDALPTLLRYAKRSEPMIACAALDGMLALGLKHKSDSVIVETIYESSLSALGMGDLAVVATAAVNLGDSLCLRASSVKPLLDVLQKMRVPDDIEAMQEVASTLGKLKDSRAIPALQRLMTQPDRSVSLAAASALQSITGSDYASTLPRSVLPLWTDFDFAYLNSLKSPACASHTGTDTICVKIATIRGDIVAELYKNYAPFTVMTFLKLAQQRGFYRGLVFHRVVPNFVVQGGDPRGDGWGGPGFSIRSEFSPLTFDTGMLGIASAGKDTEGSQFFITQSPQPHLDGRYTIFGRVISGMDAVDKLQLGDRIYDVRLLE